MPTISGCFGSPTMYSGYPFRQKSIAVLHVGHEPAGGVRHREVLGGRPFELFRNARGSRRSRRSARRRIHSFDAILAAGRSISCGL
jgi:hypothetical protein